MDQTISCIVLDDDEIDRMTTVSFLRDYPFIKITGIFETPLQVLAAAQKQPPDVLFLDIEMPAMNGL